MLTARALELAPNGLVAGIDVSADMVEAFRSRQRRANDQVLIEVKQASSNRIPYPNAHFNRVYAVHTVYFWNNPLVHLAEIRRVMSAAGRFVLAFTPKEDPHAVASFPKTVYRFYSIEETKGLLSEVGFVASAISRWCENRSRREIPSSPSPIADSNRFSLELL